MQGKMSAHNEHRDLVRLAMETLYRQADLLYKMSQQLQKADDKPRVSLA
jgi:hypothetical protein